MRKISKILIALAACFVLTGVAAAYENPDAGDTWSTATNFDCDSTYNYVEGGVASPSDEHDYWKSYDPDVGDSLEVWLDNVGYINYVAAYLHDSDGDEISRYGRSIGTDVSDTTLDTTKVYLHLQYGGENTDYTALVINHDA
jgi:hypothetical protein